LKHVIQILEEGEDYLNTVTKTNCDKLDFILQRIRESQELTKSQKPEKA